jgi:hypothetical protein
MAELDPRNQIFSFLSFLVLVLLFFVPFILLFLFPFLLFKKQ